MKKIGIMLLPVMSMGIIFSCSCNNTSSTIDEYSKKIIWSNNNKKATEEDYKWENHLIKEINGKRYKGDSSSTTYHTDFTYDNNGNMTNKTDIYYDVDGKQTDKKTTIWEYDEHQNLRKEAKYINDETNPEYLEEYVYEYDGNGNILTCTYSSFENSELYEKERYVYTYDNRNRCLSKKYQDYTSESEFVTLVDIEESVYTYQDNNHKNFITCDNYEWNDDKKIHSEKCEQNVDDNDNIIDSTITQFDHNDGEIIEKTLRHFSYHPKGFITKQESFYLFYGREEVEKSLYQQSYYEYLNDNPDKLVFKLDIKFAPPTNSDKIKYVINTYDNQERLIETVEETTTQKRTTYEYNS